MRILTRYILREVISHAVIGAAVFTFVLFTRDLGRILELVVRNSAPIPSVAEIFFYTVPVALTYTLPMGVLVGILIGLGRLAADSEITAMRAGGVGVWAFLRIISIFAVSVWLLAMVNGVWVAPASQTALGKLQDRLKGSQVSFEVQPRVFYEGFPNVVLYVQDVKGRAGAALWKGVFLADVSNPSAPRITIAEEGIVVAENPGLLHLHLRDGSMHETTPKTPGNYQISTFAQTDIPIPIPNAGSRQQREPTNIGAMGTAELLKVAGQTDAVTGRWYLIEFHRRLALPTACLVLALVGIPLGLSSKRGGKSGGFVLTILLVFGYYSISLIGIPLARQGNIPPWLGAWMADIVFFVAGGLLLWHAERRPFDFSGLHDWWNRLGLSPKKALDADGAAAKPGEDVIARVKRRQWLFAKFPTILDDYILRDFFMYLGLIVGTFLMLILVFTLFELLGDIKRNQISWMLVVEYLLNVTPYFLYTTMHLCMLLAVLVTFGLMQRSNEVTAIKATGTSIYRIIVPVTAAAAMVAVSLFFFDQWYLPQANQRQDAIHNQIKGKASQTYLRPDRKWIFGQHSDIYYYQLFDPDRDQFGSISVFQFEPKTFELTRRVYAARAHWSSELQRWVYEQGWDRQLAGMAIANYREFDVTTFPQFDEPPSYFKKEVRQSLEMNYDELRAYIRDLQQSGFDVVRLRVQLHEKLAFPIMTLVMAVLAIPFSLSAGKRGAVTGVAVAVGVAVTYIVVSRLFEAMGNLSQLPPVLAAWSPDLIFGLAGGYLILKVPT